MVEGLAFCFAQLLDVSVDIHKDGSTNLQKVRHHFAIFYHSEREAFAHGFFPANTDSHALQHRRVQKNPESLVCTHDETSGLWALVSI